MAHSTANIPCGKHSEKTACQFCRTCDSPLCQECLTSHNVHRMEEIELTFTEKKKYLEDIDTRFAKILQTCEEHCGEIDSIEKKQDLIYEQALGDISKQEQELKQAISDYVLRLKREIEEERNIHSDNIRKIKSQVKEYVKNINVHKEKVGKAMKSKQESLILKTTAEMKKVSVEFSFNQPTEKLVSFIPGNISPKSIEHVFGTTERTEEHVKGKELRIEPNVTDKLNIKELPENDQFHVEYIKSYSTDLPKISRLVKAKDGSTWISCYNKEVLQHIRTENELKVLKEISATILDIALTPDDQLLLSVSYSSKVKIVNKTGEIKDFLSVSPYITNGIHVTNDNNVIVGVREREGKGKTCRKIIIFGENGKEKKSVEHDKFLIRLFTIPFRITTNKNDDIIVIDNTYDSGRVVVLEKDCNSKWIYEGHKDINLSVNFFPQDAVTTSKSLIIVGDLNTSTLHMLSPEGELLTFKSLKEFGISYPVSLARDKDRQLWIGCGHSDKSKHTSGAKLHVIKVHTHKN